MYISDAAAGFILVALVILINFIPSFIGHGRGVKHGGLLLLANFLFGWSVIGWFACLVYAIASDAPKRASQPLRTAAYYDTHDFFAGRSKGPRIEPRL